MKTEEIEWARYAGEYDSMALGNPSYVEMIDRVSKDVREFARDRDRCRVLDLGAGTGNLLVSLGTSGVFGQMIHVDNDVDMLSYASEKYRRSGLNVSLQNCSVDQLTIDEGYYDVILMTNSLYAMGDQGAILSKIKSGLSDGGRLYIVDFVRENNVMEWALHLAGQLLKDRGLVACIKYFLGISSAIKQNRVGARTQRSGRYWLHSTSEFALLLETVGFVVLQCSPVYRNYCDYAICTVTSSPQP